MYKHLLSNRFFRENPLSKFSAQRLVYSILLTDGVEAVVESLAHELFDHDPVYLEKARQENELISQVKAPAGLLDLLRKRLGVSARQALQDKVLAREEELMDQVLERFIRSDHNTFIDNAVRLLGRSQKDYTGRLYKDYEKIRSPYVRSLACLLLGLRGAEELVPWMLDRYHELARQYPDEDYKQGPLLALHEFKQRFYE